MAGARPGEGIKWRDEFIYKAYIFAKEGMSQANMAQMFGVTHKMMELWIKNKPALRKAIDEGLAGQKRGTKGYYSEFKDFAYGRLPPAAQKLWTKLEQAEALEDDSREAAIASVKDLINSTGRRQRQMLFLHSLICTNYMTSLAIKRVGIPLHQIGDWSEDPAFVELYKGIQEAKKDFFENALINLVRAGDTAATIFANRTLNRDRGYGDRLDVNVHAQVDHSLKIDELGLSVETRRELLEKIRRNDERKQIGYNGGKKEEVTDVEVEEVDDG